MAEKLEPVISKVHSIRDYRRDDEASVLPETSNWRESIGKPSLLPGFKPGSPDYQPGLLAAALSICPAACIEV